MQLEKVTSRSNEAALAGWISSNDATLFTTVLVVAIAIFLFGQLTQGAREQAELTQHSAALAGQLESSERDLETSQGQLAETRQALQLNEQQRSLLEQELAAKRDEISQLERSFNTLRTEKAELQSQHRELVQAKESLAQERAALVEDRELLIKDRESLRGSNASLRERLAAISGQLEQKTSAFEQVEQQRSRLQEQTEELDVVIARLEKQVGQLKSSLAESQKEAVAARTESESAIQKLHAQLATREQEAKDYLIRLRGTTERFEGLEAEKEKLQRALTEFEQVRQAELLEQARNSRRLLGLTGSLDRVAVLFDASGSMRQAGSGGGERWAEAQEIAATWLQHLNVQECVLIVFASDVRTFPEDGSLADLRGEIGRINRNKLLQQLNSMTPGGWTNTYDALRKAYEYEIDSIVLFSDGVPTPPDSNRFDPAVVQRIYSLAGQYPDIPVHTVGLGNYFDTNAGNFLRTLAKLTGGTFRGR